MFAMLWYCYKCQKGIYTTVLNVFIARTYFTETIRNRVLGLGFAAVWLLLVLVELD